FIHNLKNKGFSNAGTSNKGLVNNCNKLLTVQHLENARVVLIQLAQRHTFAKELSDLDANGIIRLGGRLTNANITYDEKHPIILPAKHQLTKLLIIHEHTQLLHAGCQGMCKHIYSDNGTNFVGARNELMNLNNLLTDDSHKAEIVNWCATKNVQWHFNPPNAPHFGGLWESAVKSAKYHLKRVIGETRLTFEELYTILTQVESCMNSRPLCPLTDDPSDLTPLTPNHFLIGGTMAALPDVDLRDIQPTRLIRYQHIQFMLQHFWSRWQKEYLHQLQQRYKWQLDSSSKLRIGTLVVVKEDNLPPLKW
ncbi:uncharacterized protein LOC144478005, partial [Augochlora pura]